MRRMPLRRALHQHPSIPKERVDCVVIGAGVIGLAIARTLAMAGRDVIVLESESCIGMGTSSRNSEVIHGGIYYPPGSLKARLCVKGKQALYAYCKDHEIPHRQVGKFVVATASHHIMELEKLEKRGRSNGVEDLRLLDGKEAMKVEPQLQCLKALWSPSTGILNSHYLMLSLQADAERFGTTFAFRTTALGAEIAEPEIHVPVCETVSLRECSMTPDMLLVANKVVNASGLSSQAVAKRIKGLTPEQIPPAHFAKGCYFKCSNSPFSHLIYPVPEEGGLGVHSTLDLGGQVRFGPDVEWINLEDRALLMHEIDYKVDANRAERFYSEIRKYYPALPESCLEPDYAGIRPKITGPGEKPADFLIQDKEHHGIGGLVNLFGIESPGLTACLAIAEMVKEKLLL